MTCESCGREILRDGAAYDAASEVWTCRATAGGDCSQPVSPEPAPCDPEWPCSANDHICKNHQKRAEPAEPTPEDSEVVGRHELKCWPPYFESVLTGRKPFECRSTEDRTFAVGDTLLLREYDGSLKHKEPETEGYTGRTCERLITYVLGDGDFGVKPGFVVLGLTPLLPGLGGEDRKRLREIASLLFTTAKAPYCEDAYHEQALWLRDLADRPVSCPACHKPIRPTTADECPECGCFQYTDDPDSRRSAYSEIADQPASKDPLGELLEWLERSAAQADRLAQGASGPVLAALRSSASTYRLVIDRIRQSKGAQS